MEFAPPSFNQKNDVDARLHAFVAVTESRDLETEVELLVSGERVSGTLISRSKWASLMIERSGEDAKPIVEGLVRGELEDDTYDGEHFRVHLQQADTRLWRIRIKDIDGWSFGLSARQ